MNAIDLTNLNWWADNNGSTEGTYPKSNRYENDVKYWYKASAYNIDFGFYGIESISEVIASRVMDILGILHVEYCLINAQVIIDGRLCTTVLCKSKDFKNNRKTTHLDNVLVNTVGDSNVSKMRTLGFPVDQIIIADYIICNTDRHLANLEVFIDDSSLCPLFDHGCSLCFNHPDVELKNGYIYSDDSILNSFAGTSMNMSLKNVKTTVCLKELKEIHKKQIFQEMEEYISTYRIDYLWKFIKERYNYVRDIGLIRCG
jgi:hypothetical protein